MKCLLGFKISNDLQACEPCESPNYLCVGDGIQVDCLTENLHIKQCINGKVTECEQGYFLYKEQLCENSTRCTDDQHMILETKKCENCSNANLICDGTIDFFNCS